MNCSLIYIWIINIVLYFNCIHCFIIDNLVLPKFEKVDVSTSTEVVEFYWLSSVLSVNIASGSSHEKSIIHQAISDLWRSCAPGDIPPTRPLSSTTKYISQISFSINSSKIPWDYSDESYTLRITESTILINSFSYPGVVWAIQTLKQLHHPHEIYSFSNLPIEVHDKPSYEWRGISIDTSSTFVDIYDLEEIIAALSSLKLNVLRWKMSCNIYFPVQLADDLNMWQKRKIKTSYYTLSDLNLISNKAHYYGVRIIPDFGIHGQTGSFVEAASSDLLACGTALNPSSVDARALVVKILLAGLKVFPSQLAFQGGYPLSTDCSLEKETNNLLSDFYQHVHAQTFEDSNIQTVMWYDTWRLLSSTLRNQIHPIVDDRTLLSNLSRPIMHELLHDGDTWERILESFATFSNIFGVDWDVVDTTLNRYYYLLPAISEKLWDGKQSLPDDALIARYDTWKHRQTRPHHPVNIPGQGIPLLGIPNLYFMFVLTLGVLFIIGSWWFCRRCDFYWWLSRRQRLRQMMELVPVDDDDSDDPLEHFSYDGNDQDMEFGLGDDEETQFGSSSDSEAAEVSVVEAPFDEDAFVAQREPPTSIDESEFHPTEDRSVERLEHASKKLDVIIQRYQSRASSVSSLDSFKSCVSATSDD